MLHADILERDDVTPPLNGTPPIPAFRKEMGITVTEFSNLLPLVSKTHLTTIDTATGRATLRDADAEVIVDFQTMPERCLGALRLPVLDVSIRFRGYTDRQVHDFMARFDRSFLRMGGG